MSLQPKYPKVLKQSLQKSKNYVTTDSMKNICCGGGFSSPNNFSKQNTVKKENKLMKFLADTTNCNQSMRKQMKSAENISIVQYSSKQRPAVYVERVNHVRKGQLSHAAIEKEIENRRIIEIGEKQKFYWKTKMDELQRKIMTLQSQNTVLKQKQQLYLKFKAENAQLIQMYNNKFNQTQALKQTINYLNQALQTQQSVIKSNKSNKQTSLKDVSSKHTIKVNSKQNIQQSNDSIGKQVTLIIQDKQTKLSECYIGLKIKQPVVENQPKEDIVITNNSKQFKQFSLGNCSKISQKNSQIQNKSSIIGFSPTDSKIQTSCIQPPQINLQQQMKKLRSVYQKSYAITNPSQAIDSSQPNNNNNLLCPNQVQSHIEQLKPPNAISVSVYDIQNQSIHESIHSQVIKRLQDYSSIQQQEQKKKTF